METVVELQRNTLGNWQGSGMSPMQQNGRVEQLLGSSNEMFDSSPRLRVSMKATGQLLYHKVLPCLPTYKLHTSYLRLNVIQVVVIAKNLTKNSVYRVCRAHVCGQYVSRMHSKGSCFTLQVGGLGCVRQTARNRPQSFTTVRNRSHMFA